MESLLWVTNIPIKELSGRPLLDNLTLSCVVRWLEHFDQVVLIGVRWSKEHAAERTTTIWEDVSQLQEANRLEVISMPFAYRLLDFIRTYHNQVKLIRKKILQCQYLCFDPTGYLFGDWAAVACLQATHLSRPYAARVDRVEYEVTRKIMSTYPLVRRLKMTASVPLMKQFHRYTVSRAEVSLLQGQDCYAAFSDFSKNPHITYHTHTMPDDHISELEIHQKVHSVMAGETLQLCYVGRGVEMKGPMDWLKVIHQLHRTGIPVKGIWLGDGDLFEEMRRTVAELGLEDWIDLPGFVGDRAAILATLRRSHIFLFCHKTPEAPRCLLEALVSACPLVGYHSLYCERLVAEQGGGLFAPVDDWQSLVTIISDLNANRSKLAQLIRQSAASGCPFDEVSVFNHWSHLIKSYLNSSVIGDVANRL